MTRVPPRSQILPPEAHARISGELQPGERLLWEGQPVPGLYARGGWAISLFGVVFTAFAAFWITMAGGMLWSDRGPKPEGGVFQLFNCFPLFGLPFLAVGLGMLTAPVWMRRSAGRTVYGVTDRRAIVCQGKPFGGGIEVRSYGPEDLDNLTRVERPDGTGDLVFVDHVHHYRDSDGDRRTNRTRLGFLAIDGVREVENLIRSRLIDPHRGRGAGA